MNELKLREALNTVYILSPAKWIKKYDDTLYWYECSNCGCKTPKDRYGNDWLSNYCPDCGVYMD